MPIKLLPAMLANQIAAGEVVERPASVVKELVENSLDAGATEIEIAIEKGGHKRILIRDNGSGIAKDELELALSRHATSKISTLDDLEHIASLGFRGEALASISSVSRLTLTSKPADQDNAWQAHTEGRDQLVQIQPAAHPDGTSIDVEDLFFNTPARRKFLRAEKTEFMHIEEVVKRIALSHFGVQFVLKHNGKTIKRFAKASTDNQQQKRLAQICGNQFSDNLIALNSAYQDIKLDGWVTLSAQENNAQAVNFFYINGRVMRDKLIFHALKQACFEHTGLEQLPDFVLYLHIDPEQIDVNVHPAKHEVRFHQSRIVHDFVYRAMCDAFTQTPETTKSEQHYVGDVSAADYSTAKPLAEPSHDYIRPLQTHSGSASLTNNRYSSGSPGRTSGYSSPAPSSKAMAGFQQLMPAKAENQASQWLFAGQRFIVFNNPGLSAVDLFDLAKLKLEQDRKQQSLVSQPLLMPISLQCSDTPQQAALKVDSLADFGIVLQFFNHKLMLKQVPALLRQANWTAFLQQLCNTPDTRFDDNQYLWLWLRQNDVTFSQQQANQLWHWLFEHFGDQASTTLSKLQFLIDLPSGKVRHD
ncbi:DNA mismatch repair endonuclease MutL [Neptunicella marina]|uniref:DNA mismatch repair protein MutL n=1 Tax=Neptunicella marina TaxID=2125989 RepID=A0A8J6IU51_9ALTE|nr:DNA mismatch repair endonuclease MutL [Neptunicella marina]MBC3765837.1 DNA mismatch repair endonuclease MutL [Neptunicella marina]